MASCGATHRTSTARLRLCTIPFVALLLTPWSPTAAQDDQPAPCDSAAKKTTAGRAELVSKRDILLFAAATLSTAAVAPFDHHVQRDAHAEDMHHSGLRRTADAFAFAGGPGPFVAGGALYLVGRAGESPATAELGLTMTEGVLAAAAINGVVKGFAGRALPNAAAKPGHFSFGRGFHDNNGPFVSFPSGHTAASFAAATVLSEEATSWGPTASHLVPPAAYATATLIAVSRLYENVHWASDLPLGAAIGIWSGRTVTAWQRRHPDNWLMRRLVGIEVTPQKRRLTISAALPFEGP